MQIEKVTPKTAWQAGQIYATSWKSAYAGIVPQPYLDGLSAGVWALRLGCLVYTDFVLKDGGRYVATASVTAARDPAMHGWGEVVSIYVLPECTGLGYGKALFAHAVHHLRENGFFKIYLWVLEENHRARAFYQKMGFAPNGDKTVVHIGGKALVEMRYVCTAP